MEIKYTTLGQFIFAALGAYLLAFILSTLDGLLQSLNKVKGSRLLGAILSILQLRKIGSFFYLVGFLGAVSAFIYRWYDVGHIPIRNLFEVFITLGMLIYPLTFFSKKVLRTGGESFDMLLGAALLFPAGFIFPQIYQDTPPILQNPLFIPHVAFYMLAYIFMAKAGFQAVLEIFRFRYKPNLNLLEPEEASFRLICAGFPLLTLGFVMGSIWAKLAWGRLWGWDPKEMWSLACLLIYAGYFLFRFMFGKKYPRLNSVWILAGVTAIILTLTWANLSKLFPGLHNYAM